MTVERTGTGRLHPQAVGHLAAIADAPGIADLSVAQVRTAMLGYLDLQRPAPEMAAVRHLFIPGPTADLPVRVYYPHSADPQTADPQTADPQSADPGPAVVVFHGSGWVAANLDLVDEPARVLARDTGFVVIAVNYQKAPEHRFPIPLDDCVATRQWVHANAGVLGIDAARLGVVGDSAGGNLAAAATALAVDLGVPVAAQALLYPALDRRRDGDSYREFAVGHGLDARDMEWFWRHYVDPDLGDDPRVSPIRRDDFSSTPPTFVATASHDVLRDEAEEFAGLLGAAGVDVTGRRYDGAIHGFWWMDRVLDLSRSLQLDVADWFLRRLGGPHTG